MPVLTDDVRPELLAGGYVVHTCLHRRGREIPTAPQGEKKAHAPSLTVFFFPSRPAYRSVSHQNTNGVAGLPHMTSLRAGLSSLSNPVLSFPGGPRPGLSPQPGRVDPGERTESQV